MLSYKSKVPKQFLENSMKDMIADTLDEYRRGEFSILEALGFFIVIVGACYISLAIWLEDSEVNYRPKFFNLGLFFF